MFSLVLLASSLLHAGTAQTYVKRPNTLTISDQVLICTVPSHHRRPAEHAARSSGDNTSLGLDWRIAHDCGAL